MGLLRLGLRAAPAAECCGMLASSTHRRASGRKRQHLIQTARQHKSTATALATWSLGARNGQ
eukprot:8741316-Alexandrium_andersonii.AAC.1